jgi:hypothetical protein
MAVTSNRDVVVTGTSCQLAPDVDTPQRLFDFCAAARCSSQPIPASRWNTDHYYHPRSVEPGYYDVKAGGYLDHDVAAFDAPFFNISEADARAIDPQMRLLLENAYVALEEVTKLESSLVHRRAITPLISRPTMPLLRSPPLSGLPQPCSRTGCPISSTYMAQVSPSTLPAPAALQHWTWRVTAFVLVAVRSLSLAAVFYNSLHLP